MNVIRTIKEKAMLVAADMQGFVRVLRGVEVQYEPWDEMASTLALVDVVKNDAVEAEFFTSETDLYKAAESKYNGAVRAWTTTDPSKLLYRLLGLITFPACRNSAVLYFIRHSSCYSFYALHQSISEKGLIFTFFSPGLRKLNIGNSP